MAPGYTPAKLQFAAHLKESRKAAKLSQERAAAQVGTSRRHWIRWETGATSPNPAYLERIAEVLGDPTLVDSESDEDEESALPLSRDEYELFGRLTARVIAAKHPHVEKAHA